MSEWQPIETAPKDGTSILLYACERDVDVYSVVEGFTFEGDWLTQFGYVDATHWMPLPPAPAEGGKQ